MAARIHGIVIVLRVAWPSVYNGTGWYAYGLGGRLSYNVQRALVGPPALGMPPDRPQDGASTQSTHGRFTLRDDDTKEYVEVVPCVYSHHNALVMDCAGVPPLARRQFEVRPTTTGQYKPPPLPRGAGWFAIGVRHAEAPLHSHSFESRSRPILDSGLLGLDARFEKLATEWQGQQTIAQVSLGGVTPPSNAKQNTTLPSDVRVVEDDCSAVAFGPSSCPTQTS